MIWYREGLENLQETILERDDDDDDEYDDDDDDDYSAGIDFL